MQSIINGKRFDTTSATKIGEAGSRDSIPGDYRHWEASLYVTKRSHQYFIAGHGGAMTRFARPHARNPWQGGAAIIPMTKAEALKWAEEFLSSDVIVEA